MILKTYDKPVDVYVGTIMFPNIKTLRLEKNEKSELYLNEDIVAVCDDEEVVIRLRGQLGISVRNEMLIISITDLSKIVNIEYFNEKQLPEIEDKSSIITEVNKILENITPEDIKKYNLAEGGVIFPTLMCEDVRYCLNIYISEASPYAENLRKYVLDKLKERQHDVHKIEVITWW